MKRGEFLKRAAGWSGAAMGLTTLAPSPGRAASRSRERILVLGAGMAGLAAARYLRKRGHDVLVLEGRDRIGGRTHTDLSLGAPIDLGASWLHGIIRNPVAHLADRLGQKLMYTDFDNRLVLDKKGKRLTDSARDALEASTFEFLKGMADLSAKLKNDISLGEALRRIARRRGRPLSALEKWALRVNVEGEAGVSLDRLSLFGIQEGGELEGGDYLPDGGFAPVIQGLTGGLDIRLEFPVSEIRLDGNRVEVRGERGVAQGGRLICTLPLGVLRSGRIRFSPGLPEAKQRAIRDLGFGALNKLVLKYDRRFWPADVDFLGRYPLDDLPPGYVNMHRFTGKPIVVGLGGGGIFPAAKAGDGELVSRGGAAFARLFGKKIPASAGIVTRWHDDPFALGSYSYIPPGVSPRARLALAAPVRDRIFFAGEATHSVYPATVHGAYMSGIREARRLETLMSARARR